MEKSFSCEAAVPAASFRYAVATKTTMKLNTNAEEQAAAGDRSCSCRGSLTGRGSSERPANCQRRTVQRVPTAPRCMKIYTANRAETAGLNKINNKNEMLGKNTLLRNRVQLTAV